MEHRAQEAVTVSPNHFSDFVRRSRVGPEVIMGPTCLPFHDFTRKR